MRKLTSLLLVVALLFLGAVIYTPTVHATSNSFKEDVDVNLNIFFDEINQTTSTLNIKEGDVLSISDLGDTTGHTFEFWIVNGVIRNDLNSSATFLATSQLEIIGVYSSGDSYPVIFMDSNGKLIGNVKYVDKNETVTPPNMLWSNYSKPGYNLVMSGEEPGWQRLVGNNTFNNITQATVFTLRYTVADGNKVVRINGVDYPYDSLQTLSATNPNFTHWADPSGRVISYKQNLEVSALYDRTIIEKTTAVTAKPVVYMLDVTGIRDNSQSYLGQYELPTGYEAVAFGFKVGDSLIKSNSVHKTSNEFLRSIPNNNDKVVRAYLTFKNANGEVGTVFSSAYADPGQLAVSWQPETDSPETYQLYTGDVLSKGFEIGTEVYEYKPLGVDTWSNRLEASDVNIESYDYMKFDIIIDQNMTQTANFWMDMDQEIYFIPNGRSTSNLVELFDSNLNKVFGPLIANEKYTVVVKLAHTHSESRYAFGFAYESLTAYISNVSAITENTYSQLYFEPVPETYTFEFDLTSDNNGSTYAYDSSEGAYLYNGIAGAWANRLQSDDPMLPQYDYIVFDYKIVSLGGDIQFWMDMNPNDENVFTFNGENKPGGRIAIVESANNPGYMTLTIRLGHGHLEGWYAMGFYGNSQLYIKDIYAAKTSHVNELLGIDTTNQLVYQGSSEYVIVYPQGSDSMVRMTAVNELKYFFKEATGVELDVMSDGGLLYDEKKKYLSIGNTSLLRQTNLTIDKALLGDSGVRVATVDQSIFMYGSTKFGDLFSVYEFLEQQFDFEIYAVDEFYINRNVTNLERMVLDVTYKPSFEYRVGSYGELWNGVEFTRRMRMHRNDDVWMGLPTNVNNPSVKNAYHNFDAVKLAHNYNSNWYSNGQLKLYTYMDEISDGILELMKVEIEANPDLSTISFTHNDVDRWSNDWNSIALKNEFGTNAGEMILFINTLAQKVKAWLDVEHPGREVMVLMFAYQQTEQAPVRIENGVYVPFDNRVILEPNAGVIYAPIFAEHYYSYDDPQNSDVADTMAKWDALTDNIYMWSYGTYFPNYFMPYDNFKALQSKYQFTVANGGGKYMFDQGQFNQSVGTDWFRLKEYLTARLQWNVNQDMDTLIDNFFTNYFKNASVSMKNFFKSQQDHHTWLAAEKGITGYVSAGNGPKNMQNMRKQEYWPVNKLDEWQGYINDALSAIEPLSTTNPELYETLKYRIDLEAMSITYLKYQLYGSVSKSAFIQEANRLGIARFSEQYGINENWS